MSTPNLQRVHTGWGLLTMMLRVDEVGLSSVGTRMIESGIQGVTQAAPTLAPANMIPPAALDEVSAFAAEGFSAHTTALQAVNVVAQQEIGLYGGALHEAVAAYTASDSAGAAIVL